MMSLPLSTPGALEPFFSQLMKGRILDDSDAIVDMPQVLGELVRREENDVLAGIVPKDGYKCPLRIQWEFTNHCNLDCVFCYNARDRADKFTLGADAAMDLARQIAAMDVLEVVLSGGEVFTDWSLFQRIGRFFSEHRIGLHIITNGWFVTEEHIRELAEWSVLSVQVSIDGADEAVHDELRGMPGSWRRAVRSLRMLGEAGFFTLASCAVTRSNWQTLDDYVDLCLYLGARKVLIGDLLLIGGGADASRQNLFVDNTIYEKCVLKIQQKAARYRHLMTVQFAKDPGFAVAHTLLTKPTSLIVRYDGTAIPHCLLAFPIGDVKTESLAAIWDRVRGGYLRNDGLVDTLATIEVTQTPDLGLSRTVYTPQAAEVFL
jgi:MoaA/NifB/PqqE/SkfB family radical SAM enzyme